MNLRRSGRRQTRRAFLASLPAIALAPRATARLSAPRPNTALGMACVGVGGMGRADLRAVANSEHTRILALCDVDERRLASAAEEQPSARRFTDFRRMLDAMERDLDAVVVSTPDHMHGPIALAAMERGKHVYCQKPLAHNLRECRAMARLAAERGVVTQMGIQIHAHAAYRTAVATLRAGALGKVSRAESWVGRSWAGPAAGRPARTDPVPEWLAWDLWLGVAPERPFVKGIYHPARWRGWLDFGTGTLGDMGCHIFDPVFAGLDLAAPRSVVSRGPAHHEETFAGDGDVLYEFEGTAHTAPRFFLHWTDGRAGKRPEWAGEHLPADVRLPRAGSLILGERGVMVLPHWAAPVIWRGGERVEDGLVECPSRNHYLEWVGACRGEGSTSAPFSYAAPLTEAVLLGTVAGRFPGRELHWNSAALRFDDTEADACVERRYREGWRPQGL